MTKKNKQAEKQIALVTSISLYPFHQQIADKVSARYSMRSRSHAIQFMIEEYGREHGYIVEAAKEKK